MPSRSRTRTPTELVVESIYAAGLNPAQWLHAVEQIRVAFGGSGAVLQSVGPFGVAAESLPIVHSGQATLQDMAELNNFNSQNLLRIQWVRAGRPADWLQSVSQVVPLQDFWRTDVFNAWFKQHAIHDYGGAVLFNGKSSPFPEVVFAVGRGPGAEPLGVRDMKRLGDLVPHLRRAWTMSRALALREGMQAASLEALDRLAAGVVLLSRGGKVLHMNAAAERLLGCRDGLRLRKGRIEAVRAGDARVLSGLLESNSAVGTPLGHRAGASLDIPRPSGGRPYRLTLVPLPDGHPFACPDDWPAAIALLREPERIASGTTEGFARRHGLTPAEGRVVAALVDGLSVREATERLGVRERTVTTHLGRIFSKTGTHRQAELIRQVLAEPPADLDV